LLLAVCDDRADRIIKWSSGGAVVSAATVAAIGDPSAERYLRIGHGLAGATVAACHAPVGSYELLMMIIRGAQGPADVTAEARLSARPPDADPLQAQTAQLFDDDLAYLEAVEFAFLDPPKKRVPFGSGE
jgi:hypothetical protein